MKIRYLYVILIVISFACEYNNMEAPNERCSLEPDPGMCFAAIPKYYYDKADRKCKVFTWGGCGGVVPFNTLEECKACEQAQ